MSKENLVKEIIRTKLSEAGMSSKFRKAVEEYKEVSLKLQDLYADRAKALEGYKKAEGGEKEKYKNELSRIQKLVSPLQAQMEKAERVFNKALLSEPEELEETIDDDGMERVAAGLPQTEEEPVSEATADAIAKDLDKVKGELLKKVAELVAKKKKLYSNVDISSPMSAEEKKLDKEIADTFSQINQLVKQRRDVKTESVTEAKFKHINTGEKTINKKVMDKVKETFPTMKSVKKKNVPNMGEVLYIHDGDGNGIGQVYVDKQHGVVIDVKEGVSEALNPVAGEWVLFKTMGSFSKPSRKMKFVSLQKSHRSAQIAMKKALDKMNRNDEYGGYGIMSKDKWDKEDSRFKVESVSEGKNDKKIKELEAKLAAVKGKTPGDEGIRAAIRDDIERLKAESVSEGKKFGSKYDIGMGHMGNGVTVWNRLQKQGGDYKTIAHISDAGKVSFRDKSLPDDVKKYIEDYAKKGMNEMVNEASKRANEFFGDSKHGQEIHKMLKGKWDAKKVDGYLEELGGGSMQKNLRIIDFITKAAGLNPRKYDTQTLGKQISDLLNTLEVLYKDFTKGTEVKKFDDVRIKSKNLIGMVYAISGNNLVVRTANGLVKATKDDVEPVLSDGVMKEGNAFGMAVTQAKKDGKKEFEFNGKTYKVKKGSIEENEKETISESDCGCGAKVVVSEAVNVRKLLQMNVARELKVSPSSIEVGVGGYGSRTANDGSQVVVIGLDSNVKKISIPQADYFDKTVDYGGYLIVKADGKTGKLLKVLDRVKSQNDIRMMDYIKEVNENITEAVKEPEVITKLRDIVNRRGYATIKDPVTKKNVKVDTFSASAIIQVYDAVNDTNKQKLAALSIPKMASVAFKLAK